VSKTAAEFLKNIGPRDLTREEARALRLLRLEEGQSPHGASGVEKVLAADAEKEEGTADSGGGVQSRFLK
jgi:hypothetical protein